MSEIATPVETIEAMHADKKIVDDFRLLADASPNTLWAYINLRAAGLGADDSDARLSKRERELIAIGMGLALYKHNPPPLGHTVHAIDAGASIEEIAEIVGIAIGMCGMMSYRECGRHVLARAEERVRELSRDREAP